MYDVYVWLIQCIQVEINPLYYPYFLSYTSLIPLIIGLEEAMIGMRKSAIRRVEVPSVQVFAGRKANQLPLPSAGDDDGNRRYKNLFKTDATLLFEVLVKSIENPVPAPTATITDTTAAGISASIQ